MGCMPFPCGQKHNRALYRGKSDPWAQTLVQQSALCGSTADAAWMVNVECTAGCQAYLQQLQAQCQDFVQAFMQAAA